MTITQIFSILQDFVGVLLRIFTRFPIMPFGLKPDEAFTSHLVKNNTNRKDFEVKGRGENNCYDSSSNIAIFDDAAAAAVTQSQIHRKTNNTANFPSTATKERIAQYHSNLASPPHSILKNKSRNPTYTTPSPVSRISVATVSTQDSSEMKENGRSGGDTSAGDGRPTHPFLEASLISKVCF